MALIAVGAALGVVCALTAGAYLTEGLGWRGAFVWSGAAGLGFALLFQTLVPEPPRGWSEGRAQDSSERPPLAEVVRALLRTPSLRHTVIGAVLANTALLAPAHWGPAFFMRVHHMDLADAGVAGGVAALFAVGGGVAGGLIADRAFTRNARLVLRIPAVGMLLAAPLCFAAFRAPGVSNALGLLVLATGLGMLHSAPAGALVQTLAPLRMRALVAGVFNALLTLVGMGAGPLLTGWLSDRFAGGGDGAGLGHALSYSAFLYLWAGLHLLRGSRTLVADLERARRG
jgi:predicted MFS family arabinose efflux permease